MDLQELIRQRHSVRSYTDQEIEAEKVEALNRAIAECNQQSGLRIQLVTDDPKAFDTRLARYGKFRGNISYLAMVGPKGSALDETVGYYGEKLVLVAQGLGLNTCWVGLTYAKNPERIRIGEGEKLVCVIAVGYGETPGVTRRSKSFEKVTKVKGEVPDWFASGVEAALLAPTAVNQQQFKFILHGSRQVEARAGWGFFSKVDFGIVKYHFEVGAGIEHFEWMKK